MSGLACDTLSGSHSASRVQLFYGASQPAAVCGRHADYLTPQDFADMRKANAL